MFKPKNRNENIVVQEVESEVLIYDQKTNKAFCLNETSALIWQLCNGTRTVSEISRILSRKLKEPLTEDIIWLALDNFKRDNLLEESEQIEINFDGLSRRQVIKKIGFASLVALPVVSSLIAPSAAMGASLLANLAFCSSSSQCQSNNCTSSSSPGFICCNSGVTNASAPGSGTCTPVGNCGASYSATRCCNQNGSTVLPGPNACTAQGLELCRCD